MKHTWMTLPAILRAHRQNGVSNATNLLGSSEVAICGCNDKQAASPCTREGRSHISICLW